MNKMNYKIHHIISALFLITIFFITNCKQENNPKNILKASIGAPIGIITLPIWIAESKQFFKEEGLDLTIKVYSSGKRSMKAMFKDKVDISFSAETPFVFSSFERNYIQIISTIGASNNENKLLSRKDLGINKPSDLKNKTIATHNGAAGHFFLYNFLTKHYLNDSVKIIYKKSQDIPELLANGKIDAYCLRDYFIQKGKKLLGDKAIIFSSPGLYRKTFNMITTKKYSKTHPEALKRILKALIKAEQFIKDNRQESIKILSKKSGLSQKNIDQNWDSSYQIKIFIDQSLLISMEQQARWIINTKLLNHKQVPNFLNYFHLQPLKSVKPNAISIRE